MVKTGISLGDLIDRADGEEAGKLMQALRAWALWDSMAWRAAMWAEWGWHSPKGMQSIHRQMGTGAVRKKLLSSPNLLFPGPCTAFKMQGTEEEGEYCPFLGLLQQSHVERCLGRRCKPGCLCRNAAPCKQVVTLDLEEVNKADKGKHWILTNSDWVIAEEILHASWKAAGTSLPDI